MPASREQASLHGELRFRALHPLVLPDGEGVRDHPTNHLEQGQKLSFQGAMSLPLEFTALRERSTNGSLEASSQRDSWVVRMESEGSVDIEHLALPGMVFSGFRGRLPIEQNILVTLMDAERTPQGGSPFRLEWDPLLSENPFRRANSQEVSGLYSAARNLVLQKLALTRSDGSIVVVGPSSASLAVKQNQLLIDALDADVFGGEVSGFSLINVHPDAASLAFNGRLSRLNGGLIFGLPGLSAAESAVSGRAALFYSFADSSIAGRVDLGAVPQTLLERLIARSDPSGSDNAMAAVRKGLALARPGRVGVDFHDGVADLSLELILAGGGVQMLRVPDLPVTMFLESKMAPLRQQIEETLQSTTEQSVQAGDKRQLENEEQAP